jgi:hypothetical protein
MRLSRQTISLAACAILVFFATKKLSAVNYNNEQCNASGGCWAGCSASGGGSSDVIGASQTSECSPAPMQNCTGGNEVVCGVEYSYSSDNCDPSTITSSCYTFSNVCAP